MTPSTSAPLVTGGIRFAARTALPHKQRLHEQRMYDLSQDFVIRPIEMLTGALRRTTSEASANAAGHARRSAGLP